MKLNKRRILLKITSNTLQKGVFNGNININNIYGYTSVDGGVGFVRGLTGDFSKITKKPVEWGGWINEIWK